MIGEKIFSHKKEIKYLLKKRESDKLVIIFSGYSKNPNPELKAPYNYIKALNTCNVNQLFIADSHGYDGRGCWYLCENSNYDVEKSVIKLIEHIIDILNIKRENIILTGTSKGGFASLYYGIKYGFENIISGAPQVFLCNYLKGNNNKKILDAISTDKDELKIINNILVDLPTTKCNNINILCGINDYHLNEHIIPFIRERKDLNIKLFLYYGKHTELSVIYANVIKKFINDTINKENIIESIEYSTIFKKESTIEDIKSLLNSKLVFAWYDFSIGKVRTFMQIVSVNIVYACYLMSEGRVLKKIFYSDNPYFEFNMSEFDMKKEYEVKWFLKDNMDNCKTVIASVNK